MARVGIMTLLRVHSILRVQGRKPGRGVIEREGCAIVRIVTLVEKSDDASVGRVQCTVQHPQTPIHHGSSFD